LSTRADTTVSDLRRRNRAAVLRPLLLEGPQTRAGLARRTGLSSASMTNVVSALLDEGLVHESGTAAPAGGRPGVLLHADPQFGVVLGVDVGETGLRVAAFDLARAELAAEHVPVDPLQLAPAEVADAAAGAVDRVRSRLPGRRVLGVGVGVPGAVEHDPEGHVHAPSVGWAAEPLGALFQERIDLPVELDNGAKTLGRAEMWLGAGRGHRHAVVTLWATGVGAAIFVDGALYEGAASSAGEWGHTNLVPGGARCRCGARGCLEAYIGAGALVASAAAQREAVQLLDDPELLEGAALHFGTAAADLVNLFNPELIVVGGWVGRLLGPRLLPRIRATIDHQALDYSAARVAVEVGMLGDEAVALGASMLVLERLIESGGRVGGSDTVRR
jgi:predicted NBD/HSP70 family sugar kinase